MPPKPKQRLCVVCGAEFLSVHRKCCSDECVKQKRSAVRITNWSPEEDRVLETWSDLKPLVKIAELVNNYNKAHGRRIRSKEAVRERMNKLGLVVSPTVDNITCKALAEMLGVQYKTVVRWIKSYGLPARKVSRFRTAITRENFRGWAKEHERLLKGTDMESLAWLMEDDDFIERVKAGYRNRCGRSVALVRVDTGQKYRTIAAAGKASHIVTSAFTYHIQKGRERFECCGIQWQVLN